MFFLGIPFCFIVKIVSYNNIGIVLRSDSFEWLSCPSKKGGGGDIGRDYNSLIIKVSDEEDDLLLLVENKVSILSYINTVRIKYVTI